LQPKDSEIKEKLRMEPNDPEMKGKARRISLEEAKETI